MEHDRRTYLFAVLVASAIISPSIIRAGEAEKDMQAYRELKQQAEKDLQKFSELEIKAREGQTRGNLGVIRSTISLYVAENEHWPPNLEILLKNPKYLADPALPEAILPPHHPASNRVKYAKSKGDIDDKGGWIYITDKADKHYGEVFINCTHPDSAGVIWSTQ
jgi:hypothetical protein